MWSPTATPLAVQFLNVAVVIVKAAAFRTSTANVDSLHSVLIGPRSGLMVVNPRSGEWAVCSVPMTPQLAAEDIAGMANAHTAVTPAKSDTPFLEKVVHVEYSL